MKAKRHGFTTPLRYPGGKAMLANFIKLILATNDLLDGDYVEVYAGAAGIAWPLLFEEYVRCVHINDLDHAVVAFWQAALNRTEELCRLIVDTPVTMDQWIRQKAIQDAPGEHDLLELGFSTFFLNRTNRSGIIRGGVVGGKSQAGIWKLDARYNKGDLVDRIQQIARYSSRIQIHNLDAAAFLQQELPRLPARCLVYLDPPYFVKGEGLYEHHYVPTDHEHIAQLITSRVTQPWIVSYDAHPTIRTLYQGYRSIGYRLSYSAQERYAGSEVMFFSPGIRIPLVAHPAHVRRGTLTPLIS